MDKVICIGKNYVKHALELGDAIPEEPLYFLKPPSTIYEVQSGQKVTIEWPATGELHHELELVLRLTQTAGRWTFSHYTFGLDMTLRDLQTRLKKAGHPWEKGKVFLNSSVVGPLLPISSLASTLDILFALSVNGQQRQAEMGRNMRWQPEEILTDLLRYFPLREGDLLFTGTPEGVGPIQAGDVLEISAGAIQYQIKAQRG